MSEQPGPTSLSDVRDYRIVYLAALRAELQSRGVTSTIIMTGHARRLHLDIPYPSGHRQDDFFEDNILASPEPDHTWRFWWPEISAIGPVTDIAGAAKHICASRGYTRPTASTPYSDTNRLIIGRCGGFACCGYGELGRVTAGLRG